MINISDFRDYQLANQWDLSIDGNEKLTFDVTSIDIPFPTLSYEATTYGAKAPRGIEHVDTFSITFRETNYWRSFDFFKKWLDKIFDYKTQRYVTYPTETLARQAKLKDIQVQFYSSKSSIIPLSRIPAPPFSSTIYKNEGSLVNLKGCQPIGIDGITVDNENGDPLTFTVTFTLEEVDISNTKGVPFF